MHLNLYVRNFGRSSRCRVVQGTVTSSIGLFGQSMVTSVFTRHFHVVETVCQNFSLLPPPQTWNRRIISYQHHYFSASYNFIKLPPHAGFSSSTSFIGHVHSRRLFTFCAPSGTGVCGVCRRAIFCCPKEFCANTGK
jgi:hypothetical protein